MFAAVSASLLNNRIRNLPKMCSAIEFKRCLNTCDEPDPKRRRKKLKLDKKMAPMKEAEAFSSMWEDPKCCHETCETFRHDLLYLKKDPTRTYTRTWNECEDYVKERYVCVGDILPPEREKRPRRVQTKKGARKVCQGDEFKLDLLQCIPPRKLDLPCARMRMPGCKTAREPPTCNTVAKPSCCQKRCTQYPSYSECTKPKPKVKPPSECACLKVPSNCEVFAMFRKYAIK